MKLGVRCFGLVFAWILFAFSAQAEPITSGADATGMANKAASPAVGGALSDSGANQAKRPELPSARLESGSTAVDMLVDMQSRTAGLKFSDRPHSPRDLTVGRAAVPAGPTANDPSHADNEAARAQGGLFGSGATPIVANRQLPTPDSSTAMPSEPAYVRPAAMDEEGGGRSPAADIDGGTARRLHFLPIGLIAFVRDNRTLVVAASLTVLALFWAGSLAVSHLRR